jgi:hypothetical protein
MELTHASGGTATSAYELSAASDGSALLVTWMSKTSRSGRQRNSDANCGTATHTAAAE